MANILLLEQCYDAKTACARLNEDISTNINDRLKIVHDFLANKTDDYFDKAFTLAGYNPLKKKRDEIIEKISEREKENEKYKNVIERKFWDFRLKDLESYKEYLNSELTKINDIQDKLLKSMQKENNYMGIQGSTRYSEYLANKREKDDILERISGCDKEISVAKNKVNSLGSIITGGI